MIQTVELTPPEYLDEEETDDATLSPLAMLAAVLRHRGLVLGVVATGLAVTLGVALLKPRTYSSSFSFVPASSPDPRTGGLASLAGQFGLSIAPNGNAAQSPQFYADLLKTREVLTPIALDSFALASGGPRRPLAELLDVAGPSAPLVLEETMRAMRDRVISSSVATRTTGVVSVRVTSAAPGLSLEIARRLIAGLNEFDLTARQTQASAERRFTEGRLRSARASLRAAENAVVQFLRTNRQFASSPELSVEYQRLQREVALHQVVVTGLAQSYEVARIGEVRDTPVLTVIERPVLPAQPDARGRLKMLIVGLIVSSGVGVLAALLRDAYVRLRIPGTNPAFDALIAEWRRPRRDGKGAAA